MTCRSGWHPRRPVLDLFTMARNRATLLRMGVAAASWGLALGVAQAVLGASVSRPARELERRIELHLRGADEPAPQQPPARSHEEESLEPWELVSV